MTYPLFDFWLERTKVVQEQVYGYDYATMSVADKSAYVQTMLFAAMVELGECSREFAWKPWATDEAYLNREKLVFEIIDALHFLGDILVCLGVDGRELNHKYTVKLDENIARKKSNQYKAVKDG